MIALQNKPLELKNPKDMTNDDAIQIAEKIAYLEAGIKGLKEHLKKFVELNGPVETTDMVWDKFPSCSWKFTSQGKREFAEMIAIEGMNPWDYLDFSKGSLTKLGWSDEVIGQYAENKTNYSFRSKKKEG